MHKTIPAAILFILLLALLATPQIKADESDLLRSLLGEATREHTSHQLLTELTATANHRLSGSQGLNDAIAWAERTMKDLGFENVRVEPVTVPHWVRGDTTSVMVGDEQLPAVTLGGSVATPKRGVTAPVVAVSSFEQLNELGMAGIKGKIVLYTAQMDPAEPNAFRAYGNTVKYRWAGASMAAKFGAKAVLVRSMTIKQDNVPHGGGMGYEDGVAKIPAAALSWQAAESLAQRLQSGEQIKVTMKLNPLTKADALSGNVVGELVGSELPNEVVILSCHLDSWDLGDSAHDDGGGCVQAIEALRLLKTLGIKPKRTVRALLYTNEENGGRGGRTYADNYAAQDKERIVLAVESDRGAYTPLGFSTPAGPEWEAILTTAAEGLAPLYADRVEAGYSGADVRHLAPHGVATAGLIVSPHRYFDMHHSESDRLADVHPRELAAGAVAYAWLALSVADIDGVLPPAPVAAE